MFPKDLKSTQTCFSEKEFGRCNVRLARLLKCIDESMHSWTAAALSIDC